MKHSTKNIISIAVIFCIFSGLYIFLVFYPPYHLSVVAPPDTYYTKPHHNLHDYYQYLASIRQGRLGISGVNRYTTKTVPAQYLHLYYESLGLAARAVGVTDTQAYYLSIAVAIVLSVLGSLLFIYSFIPRGYRVLAGLFVFLCGPLPQWWITLFGRQIYVGTSYWTRTDIWSRYAMVPHHGMGVALMTLGAWFLFRFIQSKNTWNVFISCIFFAMSSVVYLMPAVLFWLSMGLCILLLGLFYGIRLCTRRISMCDLVSEFHHKKRVCLGVGAVGIATTGIVVYMLRLGPVEYMRSAEYLIGRPEQFPFLFSLFVLSHGILLLFYLFALFRLKRAVRFTDFFLISITVTPWMCYLLSSWDMLKIAKYRLVYTNPYLFGGLLATLGAIVILRHVGKKFRGSIIFCVIILILGTTVGNIASYWLWLTKPGEIYVNTYIPRGIMEGLAYLNASTPPHSHVLSTHYTGMFIPSYTFASVYVGHELVTIDYFDKLDRSWAFFRSQMPLSDTGRFFKDNHIEYVFWDIPESPQRYALYMKEVFRNADCTIFQVVDTAL